MNDSIEEQQFLIPQIIDSGITRRLVSLFTSPKTTDSLKFELAWIFSNMTMGNTEQLILLKNCGVLNALIKHIKNYKGKYTEK